MSYSNLIPRIFAAAKNSGNARKRSVAVLVLALMCTVAAAQPTISSVSPLVGLPGSTVTIAGTNFNTTPANDIVYFGATRATVTGASATSLTVTVPAGATYMPVSVENTATHLSAYSDFPFLPSYNNTSYGMDHINFDPAVAFGSGTGMLGVTIGDIDGDGKPDIVIVSTDSHTVSVLRNIASSGTLTSSSFAAPVVFAVGSGPDLFGSAVIADIDGDGKPDLAVVNTADSTISLLRNTSSPGSVSLAAQVVIHTGYSSYPRMLVIGDIDGDGKPDMACVNTGNNTMSLFHNISVPGTITTGSFEARVTFPTGNYPNTMAIGDLDGDGKPELVTTNNLDNNISVFRNTATSGTLNTSSLATALTFTVAASEGVVTIGDMDGDGKQDIIVAANGGTEFSISVLRNTSSGSITFAPRVVFPTGVTPWQIAIGDINGDGKPDLGVSNLDDYIFSTFINTSVPGDVSFVRVDFPTSGGATGIAIGDLDGDGRPDLIIDTGALFIYRNHPDTSLAPVITSVSPAIANPGTAITITGLNFNSTPGNDIVYFGATRATVTAASSTALSVTVPTGATYQPVSVDNAAVSRTGYSDHAFLPTYNNAGYAPGRVNFDPAVHLPVLYANNGRPAIADLDGDGKPDVVSISGVIFGGTTRYVSVFRNTATSGSLGLSSFAAEDTFTVDYSPSKVVIGDVDGDGKLDIIVASYYNSTISILRNTSTPGSLSFAPALILGLGISTQNPLDLAIGDLNGDGRLDIAVPGFGEAISIFQNESTPGVLAFAPVTEIPVPGYLSGIAIGDIDGDGKADLVIPSEDYDAVTVWRNIYTGGAIRASSFDAPVYFPTGLAPIFVCIADFDGDGKPDLAVQNGDAGTTSVLRNTSSAGSITSSSFAPQVTIPTLCPSGSGKEIEVGDLDGDGRPDLVIADEGLSIFRNSATSGSITLGSFTKQVIVNAVDDYYGAELAIGDLDGDGKPDIAVGGASGSLTLFRNDPLGPAPVITSVNPVTANVGTAATITGNYFNTTAANNIVYFGATRATVTSASSTSLNVTVPVGATYDYVTVNNDSSMTAYSPYFFLPKYDNSPYIPNTVHFDPQVVFTTSGIPNCTEIADMDGDGKADLVVVNQISGTISVYLNTAASGSVTAGSFAAPVDFPVGGFGVDLTVVGDVDGDGRPDIVFSGPSSSLTSGGGQIAVLRNTSSVGSLSFELTAAFAASHETKGIAIGDINGDGKPDIAAASSIDNMIFVFQNVSAPGNVDFAMMVAFAAGTSPDEIAIGDIDGDGRQDLIVPNYYDNTISVFRNTTPPGAYIDTNSFSARVDFSTGTNPSFVTVGDVDGDRKADVVVLNADNTASIFHNTASSGIINAGSLTALPALTLRNSSITIKMGDITGDGRADLVVNNAGDNTVSVFRNTSAPGAISFAADTVFTIGAGGGGAYGSPHAVAIGDIDGDGKSDIVAANLGDNTLSVLRNDPLVASPILGNAPMCIGSDLTLSDATPGGTWSSATPAVATIGSTGIVHAVAAGTSVISYVAGGITSTTIVTVSAGGLPTIASVSPLNGNVASAVTITGTNFSGSDIIYFGATQAAISSATSTVLNVTVPVDATYANVTVTDPGCGLTAYAAKPFLPTYDNSAYVPGLVNFAPAVNFPSGNSAEYIKVVDVDGDGRADLVVYYLGYDGLTDTVSIYLNTSATGSITSGSFAAPVNFSIPITQNSISVGDLDGDGKMDVLLVPAWVGGPVTATVMRNTSSPGSVSFAVTTTGFPEDGNCNVSDLDGDGKADVAIVNFLSGQVSIYLNTSIAGAVSFGPPASFDVGPSATDATIGDIDGDGKPDLAIESLVTPNIYIMRNISVPGAVNFSSSVSFAVPDTTNNTGILLSDLDGDGKQDIILKGPNSATVLRNTSSVGSFSFGSPTDFPVNGISGALSTGDVDGDGKPDLIVESGGNIWGSYSFDIAVLRNKSSSGSIQFDSAVSFGNSFTITALALGDLDADGKPDIIFANGTTTSAQSTITVLKNTPIVPAPIPVVSSVTPGKGNPGTAVTITGSGFSATSTNDVVYFGATRASVTSASSTSLTVNVPGGANFMPISVDVPTQGWASAPAPFMPTFDNSSYLPGTINYDTLVNIPTADNTFNVTLCDFDGDGKPDLVVGYTYNGVVNVYRNISAGGTVTSGSFAAPVTYSITSHGSDFISGAIKAVDVDLDGKPDIVAINGWGIAVLHNNSTPGSLSFDPQLSFASGEGANNMAIGDLDGDGKPDIVIVSSLIIPTSLCIMRNTSVPGRPSFAMQECIEVDHLPYAIAICDIDGDGKQDVCVGHPTNTLSVLLNRSSLSHISFASPTNFTSPYPAGGEGNMATADFDGDGKQDIVINDWTSGAISVLHNTSSIGTPAFDAPISFDDGSDANPSDVAVGDMDGDGKPDLAIMGQFGIRTFHNNSTTGSITASSFAITNRYKFESDYGAGSMAMGDLNADGKPEIVAVATSGNTIGIFTNDPLPAPPIVTALSKLVDSSGTSITITGLNFNAAPANDIVYFGATRASVTSATTTSMTVTVPVGATNAPVSVLNNANAREGSSPKAFLPTYNGAAYLAGSVNFDTAAVFTHGDTLSAIGDIDGDGKADVVTIGSGALRIYRNISTSGSVTTSSFAAPVVVSMPAGAAAIALGDMDGDGKLDVVVANNITDSIYVFSNTSASGAPSVAAPVRFINADAQTTRLIIGDVDGDGRPDMITVGFTSSLATVYYNKMSQGVLSFFYTNPIASFDGAVWSDVALADMDGDGKPELIIAGAPFEVIVYPNTSGYHTWDFTSGFNTAPVIIPVNDAFRLGVNDMDGDGKPDIVSMGSLYSTVSVLRNTSTPGAISTAPEVIFADSFNTDMAIADIDGNGKPDIVTSRASGPNFSVLRNTSVSGTIDAGSFTILVVPDSNGLFHNLVAGDIDGDGKADLVACDGIKMIARRNDPLTSSPILGNAPMCVGSNLTLSDATPGGTWSSATPAVATIGSTGIMHAVAAGTAVISYVTGGITSTTIVTVSAGGLPTIASVSPLKGNVASAVTITGTNYDPTDVIYFGATRAAVSSSTGTVLNVTVPMGATYMPVTVTNTGCELTAYSEKLFLPTYDNSSYIPNILNLDTAISFPTIGQPSHAHIIDIDGDGKPDILTADLDSAISIMLNTSSGGVLTSGSFAAPVRIPLPISLTFLPYAVTIGDINGDGKPDLLLQGSGSGFPADAFFVMLNTSSPGSVTFGSVQSFSAGTTVIGCTLGDIDGDGRLDVLTYCLGSQVQVFRNTSGVGSALSFAAPVVFPAIYEGLAGMTVGDIDGDGKTDLLLSHGYDNHVSVFLNNSSGSSVSFQSEILLSAGGGEGDVSLADIDGDGRLDIAIPNSDDNTIDILHNISSPGSMSFDPLITVSCGAGVNRVKMSDMDGDGKPDMVVLSGGVTVSVYRSTSTSGTVSFALPFSFGGPTNIDRCALGDVDGDGKPDVVTVNYGPDKLTIFRNDPFDHVPAIAGVSVVCIGVQLPLTDMAAGGTWISGSPGIASVGTDGVVTGISSGTATISYSFGAGFTATAVVTVSTGGLPSITSVSPLKGNVASAVTITGTNFSGSDVIYFGATQAAISSATSTLLNVTVPTDATYANVTVTDPGCGLTAYADKQFLPTYNNSAYVPGTVNFDMFNIISDTSGLTTTALADIDGDGKADLVTFNNSHTISVYRNISSTGSISSSSFAAPVTFPTDGNAVGLTVGDLDGDGKQDIAMSLSNTSTGWWVSIYHNTSIPGTVSFDAAVDLATNYYGRIGIGDIDGDGKNDIISIDNSGWYDFAVFHNIGPVGSITAGSFDVPVFFGDGFAGPWNLVVTDLDGDGKSDVVVNDVYGPYVGVYQNTASAGTIDASSFAPQVILATGGLPTSVVAADIDGDGKPDLIVANTFDSTISVLRNTTVSGPITSGSFAPQVLFFSAYAPGQLAVSDVDGDGKPDIAVVNEIENSISVFRNTATAGTIAAASLAPAVKFFSALYPGGDGFTLLLSGDIDGDGKPDLVVSGAGLSVLRNDPLLPAPKITSVSPRIANPGTAVTIAGVNFNSVATNNIVYFGATRATVSSGSSTSLNVTVPVGASYNMVTVNNDSDMAAFAPYAFLPKYNNSAYVANTVNFDPQVVLSAGTLPNGDVIADIDADGKPDLLVANTGDNTISVYRNMSSTGSLTAGSFAAPVVIPTGDEPSALNVTDVDGDGKPDIVFTIADLGIQTVSILRNTSSGGTLSFAPVISFQAGVQVSGLAVGDIDGDGKPDLAVANNQDNTISIFRNVSIAGWVGFTPQALLATGNGPWSIAMADIDGDGRPDLVVPNQFDNTISVFRNTSILGNTNYNPFSAQVTFATGLSPAQLVLTDIDGDGKADVVVVNTDSTLSVLRNTATSGSITSGSFAAQVVIPTGNSTFSLAAGDINGDGKPDVVVINNSNTVSVLRNTSATGSISFGAPAIFAVGASVGGGYAGSFWGVAVGDIDGDGKADIAAVNNGDNTVSILRNDPLTHVPAITGTSHICVGGTLSLTDSAAGGTWSSGAAGVATVGSTGIVTAVSVGTATISYSFGAGFTVTTVVTVNAGSLPVITSVSPLKGNVASAVTITGTGFSSSDIVYFGPEKATISSTSGTVMHVTVPVDAAYAPVTVTDPGCGLTGYAELAFIPTYDNSPYVPNTVHFDTGNIQTGSADFASRGICDINGDGKPDLVLVSNDGTLSVYLNISSTGSISYATRVVFPTGTTGVAQDKIAIGDIDGDGKPDVVFTDPDSEYIWVMRNTSSISTVSFDAPVGFAGYPDYGAHPLAIAIADLDGDGKPEVVITTVLGSYNAVNVFRNTSSPGNINPGSFAAPISYENDANYPWQLAISDIDGDGKPEILVGDEGANSISVFHNTSSTGVLDSGSFEPRVIFSPGTVVHDVTRMVIGDIDGDGKPDLVVTRGVDSSVAVLQNTATPGTINSGSFAAPVGFRTGQLPMGLALGDIDGDGKTDIAVVNRDESTISVFRNTATIGVINASSFATQNKFVCDHVGISQYYELSLGDIDGDGKPDVTIDDASGEVTTLLNDPLTASPILGNLTICVGANSTLSDATTGGTWSSGAPGIATVGSTGIVHGVAAGTATISYTVGVTSVTAIVTINPLPNAGTITGTTTVCAGASTSLTDAVSGGTWSSFAAGIATVGSTGIVNGVSVGTTLISYTVTNSCGSASAITTVGVSAGSAGIITGSTGVCLGGAVALTDAVTGGTWSSGNPGTAGVGATGLVTGLALGTATISYTTGGTCGGTATIIVTVSPSVSAGTITGVFTVCSGATTNLTDAVSGGFWSSSNTIVATVGSTGIVSGLTTGTATVFYTVSNTCGTVSASHVVTVNPPTSAGSITGTAIMCGGSGTALTDAVTGGVWSSTNLSVATVGSTGSVTGLAAGTSVISYSVTNSCGVTTAATRVVTVNAAPNAGTITGTTTICGGGTTPLTDAVTGGTWSSGATGVATVSGTGVVTGVSIGTATISYTVSNTCGSAIATAVVNVTSSSAGTITGPTGVVIASSIALTDATSGGTWSASNGNATVSPTGLVTGVAAGTVTISYSVSGSCGTVVATKIITVTHVTSVSPISGYFFYFCTGANATFWDVTTGGTWDISPASVATVSATGIATGISAGTATLSYSYGGTTVTQVVTVYPTPAAITGSNFICVGSTATLSETTTGGTWSSSATPIATVGATGVVNALAPGTTNIYYTIASSGCRASLAVTVTPGPSPIMGTTTVCPGSAVSLSDLVAGGSWSTTSTNISVGSTGLVTGLSTGSSSITYTLASGCFAVYHVTVNAAVAPISGTTAVCAGATTVLTDATTGGTSWTSSTTSVATVTASGVVTGVTSGTSIITYKIGTGCIATTIVTVGATVSAITNNSALCAGTSITLSDPTASGTWSTSNPAIATVGVATGIVNGIAGGTATITYSTAGSGCYKTAIVTVNPLPNAGTLSGSDVVCIGGTTSLSDASAGGVWTSSNPATGTVNASGLVSGISGGTTTVSYTLTNGCGSATATTVVTVNAAPVAGTISGVSTVCAGSTTSLSDAVPGGTWSSAVPARATVGSTGIVTGVAAGTVAISYTVTNSCGSTSATYVVTVNSVLAGTISGASSVITGLHITLSDVVAGGTWSSSAPGIATVGSTGMVTGVSPGTVTISYTVTNSCGSASATMLVSVNASSVAPITGTASMCLSATTSLTDATPGGTWSSSNSFVASVSTAGTVTGVAVGTATISYTVAGVPAFVVVTVNPVPSSIIGAATVCFGSSVTMTDLVAGGTWTSTSGVSVTTGSATTTVTGLALGASIVTYSLAGGCYKDIAITVNPLPLPISGTLSVCVGSTTHVSDATSGGISWTSSNTAVATVGGAGGVHGLTAGTTLITYTISTGCRATATVTVSALPVVAPITGPSAVTTGTTISLTDATPGGLWSNNHNLIASVGSLTGIVTGGSRSGTATVSYTVTNAAGCVAAATKVITNSPAPPTHGGSMSVLVGGVVSLADDVTGGDWACSDNTIATVDGDGTVTGLTAGIANITHTTINNGEVSSIVTQIVVNSLPFEVRVVPNPNQGTFSIRGTVGSDKDETVTIEITNMLGQAVYNGTLTAASGVINEQVLLNSNLANGMYLLDIKNGNEHKVFHFVMEK